MFTVNVPRLSVKTSKLVDKKTGVFLEEQLVLIVHPEQFAPVQCPVLLEAGQHPYEVGNYEMASDSITGGEFGRPAFRLKIGKRLDAVIKKAA